MFGTAGKARELVADDDAFFEADGAPKLSEWFLVIRPEEPVSGLWFKGKNGAKKASITQIPTEKLPTKCAGIYEWAVSHPEVRKVGDGTVGRIIPVYVGRAQQATARGNSLKRESFSAGCARSGSRCHAVLLTSPTQ